MSEWRFHHDGEKFKIKKVDYPSCQGCHFENSNDACIRITACSICTGKSYQMIFVKDEERELEMACQGDEEWDAKYETFERHYPLIKWAVIAGLLGLVWLVSL